ncbi:MAG: hypothetical protein ACKVVT_00270 [Dehalococcoidia bacterium]
MTSDAASIRTRVAQSNGKLDPADIIDEAPDPASTRNAVLELLLSGSVVLDWHGKLRTAQS